MRVLTIFGTRPEAIKLAPVIKELAAHEGLIASRVCVTGQHRQILDQVLDLFSIKPDIDLDTMRPGQDLTGIMVSALLGLKDVLRAERPDIVLVQGDTATCFAAALSAYYEQIPVGHVEAGLRTGDLYSPFPEEGNRVMTARLARWHFAPTEEARRNLLAEGIKDDAIRVTGNTVIDALIHVRGTLPALAPERLSAALGKAAYERLLAAKEIVLLTAHRRENFGPGLATIFGAVRDLAKARPASLIAFPVHPNPNVQEPAASILGGLGNVLLLPPLDYQIFVWLMNRSALIMTDSGGIQEEAPSLGKPVLVLREVSERLEAIEQGSAALVGAKSAKITQEAARILDDAQNKLNDLIEKNPFGDGLASKRIVNALIAALRN
ncbi:MAG: UDP-N-acetylglucosamine 2-epimerase (non-hydrolyzing) [Alphaproteobacteria bacterium]|nr:UDP-N-acetylglucosamine 2-epimerase (non-hydrolyzing) [Alphaproteobacteria bacterium]